MGRKLMGSLGTTGVTIGWVGVVGAGVGDWPFLHFCLLQGRVFDSGGQCLPDVVTVRVLVFLPPPQVAVQLVQELQFDTLHFTAFGFLGFGASFGVF